MANEGLSDLKHSLHDRDHTYISFQNFLQIVEKEIADAFSNDPLNLLALKQENERNRELISRFAQNIQKDMRLYEHMRRQSGTVSEMLFTTLAAQFLEESSSEPKQMMLKEAKKLIDKFTRDAKETFSHLEHLLRLRDDSYISFQNFLQVVEKELADGYINPLIILAKRQEVEK